MGKVQQTEQQFLLRGEKYIKQSVMLPHEIVASMYNYPMVFFQSSLVSLAVSKSTGLKT